MGCVKYLVLVLVFANILSAEEELKDFEFSDPDEMMIAQESRSYQSVLHPSVRIVKPHGVTNSHRPQYDLDSYEEGHSGEIVDHRAVVVEVTTKRYAGVKNTKEKLKEGQIKDAVLRALERKDHKGKFAQVLPIIRAMSGQQRVALAALVASQVNTPPGRTPLNLAQVRSMFGNADNTTADLMLPILLDMANLIRRAVRSGKEQREVKEPQPTHPQILRRSFNEDPYLDDEPFDTGVEITTTPTTTTAKAVYRRRRPQRIQHLTANTTKVKEQNKGTEPTEQNKRTEHTGQNKRTEHTQQNKTTQHTEQNNTDTITKRVDTDLEVEAVENDVEDDKNKAKLLLATEATSKIRTSNTSKIPENSLDLSADATNQTITQDLPVAEKLRAFNRFIDRKAHPASIRRGNFPKPTTRRANAEPTISPVRRRPQPSRKLPAVVADQGNCELFTNTLCLHSEDYPTDAIVQSIRRNKAAAGALLADFKDPGDGALDGVTAAQEAKYTAAAAANRRKDTNNREFATAGEAGFMCPSTVKYARPQRARATSGQWKYIVNTGEHTQTLRLEKCLKPKESCTFLTDNFKSKCVQVYNYHRLLTWDQQNGLHMDIFKVPTCCSCHIEGYSVSFPPLGHRVHETSSNENFPGEDLSAEHGNQAFEQVQSTIQRPTRTPPFLHKKPIESFPPYTDNQNLITANQFQNIHEEEFKNGNIPLSNPMDSYGNTYFPDSYNQATSIRQNIKRPPARNTVQANNFDQITLPSYLEPPTPSATSTFFTKENNKFKPGNQYKRGANRNRRPIRKKIGGGPDDLTSSGTSAIGNLESLEDFNDDLEDPDVLKPISNPNGNVNNFNPSKRGTIAPKLQAASIEGVSTTFRPEQKPVKENISVNGKRVNYNYHPIIDFFEEGAKDENQSIDRDDSVPFVRSETEWKPLSVLPSRTTSNLGSRSKHK